MTEILQDPNDARGADEALGPGGVDPQLAAYIDQVATFHEDAGLPRMAGRILGWLLVCTPAHQSAEELSAALGASRASISTMTQLLARAGLIERVSVPGSRRTYVRQSPSTWTQQMRASSAQVARARRLAEAGEALLASSPGDGRRRVEEMRRFYTFFERELPALIERWEREET